MDNHFSKTNIPSWPLIILLFTSVDTNLFGTNADKTYLFIPRILSAIAIIILPIMKTGNPRKIIINWKELLILIFMLSIMSISTLINREPMETYLSRIVVVILAYVICRAYSIRQFANVFDCFIFIVSIFNIITEVMAYITPNLLRKLPAFTNTAGYTFYSYIIGGISTANGNLNSLLIRGQGILWEPGAYAIYLVFALLFQLFVFETSNYKRIFLYILCLIITFSTTGYLSFLVLIIGFLMSKRTSNMSKWLKNIFILFAILIAIAIVILDTSLIYDTVFSKLTNGTSGATTRYSSFFNGIKVAFDHPLFGVASDSSQYMAEYVFSDGSIFNNGGTSITNTVVAQYASYGLIFGTMFLLGTLRYLLLISKSKFEWFFLCLTIMMTYFGEKFFSFFPFVFVFYGLCKKEEII